MIIFGGCDGKTPLNDVHVFNIGTLPPPLVTTTFSQLLCCYLKRYECMAFWKTVRIHRTSLWCGCRSGRQQDVCRGWRVCEWPLIGCVLPRPGFGPLPPLSSLTKPNPSILIFQTRRPGSIAASYPSSLW